MKYILVALAMFACTIRAQATPSDALNVAMQTCIAWGEKQEKPDLKNQWMLAEKREQFNDDGELSYQSSRYNHRKNFISIWIEAFADLDSQMCAVSPMRSLKSTTPPDQDALSRGRVYTSSIDMRDLLAKWAKNVGPTLGYVEWPEGRELAHTTAVDVKPEDVVAALKFCSDELVATISITEKLNAYRKTRGWFVSYRSMPAAKDRYTCKSK